MQESAAKTRKKVLFVITKSNFGGAQRYVLDLATHLPKNQFEVAVAAGGTGEPGSEAGLLFERLSLEGIRTIHVPELARAVHFFNDFFALRALYHLFSQEHPDVIHLNSSKAGGLGALAARFAGISRIVFTAHGWPFWENRNIFARAIIFLASVGTVWLSHMTICISKYDARPLRWCAPKSKVSVIYNRIDAYHLRTGNEARTALFSPEVQALHEKDHWVLTNAELNHNKNIFAALDAIHEWNQRNKKQIFYTIIGAGTLSDAVRKYVESKHMTSMVSLLGFVRDARMYYKAFDAFFLPSLKEGVPYVILEAQRAGMPIVASRVGGIPEVLPFFLVDPKNKESLVEGLSKALTDDTPQDARAPHPIHTMVTETIERAYEPFS